MSVLMPIDMTEEEEEEEDVRTETQPGKVTR